MQEFARTLLYSVRERVAEIQFATVATLLLVTRHNIGFDMHSPCDRVKQKGPVCAELLQRMPLEQFEQTRIGNQPGFDDLGQPGAKFAFGQGLQQRKVAQHEIRLVEGAHHILVSLEIHAVFAADTRIHLRQQRRGHEAERQSAHIGRSDETGNIGHDSAAETEDERTAVGPERQQFAVKLLGRGQRFVRLAQSDQAVIVRADDRTVGMENMFVRNDNHALAFGQIVLERVDHVADHDPRRALARTLNLNGLFHINVFKGLSTRKDKFSPFISYLCNR